MALMMRLHVLASSGLAAAFWVISRYFGKAAQRPLSPTADIRQGERHVCFGPFPDSRTAANHASQQLRDRGSPNNPITTPNSWHSRAGVRAVHRIETRPASYGSYWNATRQKHGTRFGSAVLRLAPLTGRSSPALCRKCGDKRLDP